MKTLYCTVNYYFKGGFWIKPLKWIAEKSFMSIRSKCVALTNPVIERYNVLWDLIHPELKGSKLEGEILETYDRWMSERLNEYMLECNGSFPGNLLFEGKFHPDYPDFRLYCKFNRNMIVDYDLNILTEEPT